MVLSKPVLLIRSQIGRIFLLPISQTLDFTSFICLMTSSLGIVRRPCPFEVLWRLIHPLNESANLHS